MPSPCLALNGLNQLAFGARSVALGGADIAVAQDTSALNTNPAGLSQIRGSTADFNLAAAYAGDVGHKDRYGNDVRNANTFPVLGGGGYATRWNDSPFTFGIGLFAQGGTGNEFANVRTVFGTTDDLSSILRLARITPGFSWQVNEQLSLGVSALVSYGDVEQGFFPGTSNFDPLNPSATFFGYELEAMSDIAAGWQAPSIVDTRQR